MFCAGKGRRPAFTEGDNLITRAEAQLSEFLSVKLNARPEVSLKILYMSIPIQKQIRQVLMELQERTGKPVSAVTESYREKGGKRRVIVTIHKE